MNIVMLLKPKETVAYIYEDSTIRQALEKMKSQEKYFVRDLIRSDFNPSVKISVDMKELYERALNQNFIPVTDDSGVFIGIVTRKDLISHFVDKSKL